MSRIKSITQKYIGDVIQWRHWLHAHPEVSTKEKETSAFIRKTLEEMGLEVRTYDGSYGLTAVIDGEGQGKCLGLRADFDALPIAEKTGLEFSSVNIGVMHACGHDMHTSILLGTAAVLNDMRDSFCGKVKLIFQPSEEQSGPDQGAIKMIQEGCMDNPRVDAVIGEHMWPELKVGEIGLRSGVLTAATDRFEITVHGKAAHGGSYPEKGVDAIVIASHIITALQTIKSRNASPFERTVLSICQINGGTAYNIIADKVVLAGTLRNTNEAFRAEVKERIKAICDGISESMGGSCEIVYKGSYDATNNDPGIIEIIRKGIENSPEEMTAVDLMNPSMIGEDFSKYAHLAPSGLYCFGTRENDSDTATLHQCNFAPSDGLIEKGIETMVSIALEYMQK
ncbi:MAG: M20 family metallopeptidase [Lachnospiraceae bacterium]|nr:M20 family metallopeptidase [Lachnospiraceae bacterium]